MDTLARCAGPYLEAAHFDLSSDSLNTRGSILSTLVEKCPSIQTLELMINDISIESPNDVPKRCSRVAKRFSEPPLRSYSKGVSKKKPHHSQASTISINPPANRSGTPVRLHLLTQLSNFSISLETLVLTINDLTLSEEIGNGAYRDAVDKWLITLFATISHLEKLAKLSITFGPTLVFRMNAVHDRVTSDLVGKFFWETVAEKLCHLKSVFLDVNVPALFNTLERAIGVKTMTNGKKCRANNIYAPAGILDGLKKIESLGMICPMTVETVDRLLQVLPSLRRFSTSCSVSDSDLIRWCVHHTNISVLSLMNSSQSHITTGAVEEALSQRVKISNACHLHLFLYRQPIVYPRSLGFYEPNQASVDIGSCIDLSDGLESNSSVRSTSRWDSFNRQFFDESELFKSSTETTT